MRQLPIVAITLLVLATPALTGPAVAGDEPELTGREFRMPSGNITCAVQDAGLEGSDAPSKRLYCVRNLPTTLAVILDERGLESYPTEGDQPFSPSPPTLNYGDNWDNGGFSCDSSRTGLLCSHPDYGAFELARKGLKKLK